MNRQICRTGFFAVSIFLVAAMAHAAAPPSVSEVKLLVEPLGKSRPIPAPILAETGARVLADYPASHAVVVPSIARDRFIERMLASQFEVHELGELIHTPRQTIDPRADVTARVPFDTGLFLIQYVAPPVAAWQAAIQDAGMRVIESLPERTVLVSATAQQITKISRMPWVQYVGPYLAGYKFAPAATSPKSTDFDLQLANTTASAAAIARIRQRVGGFRNEIRNGSVLTVRIRTDLTTANALLEEPFVVGVHTYIPYSNSDERQALALTGPIAAPSGDYLSWLAARGITPDALTDSGIIVDIADTGLDRGCATPTHADLGGRIVRVKGPVDPYYVDSLFHGTIVAGIVGANPQTGKDVLNQPTAGYAIKDGPDAYGQYYYGLGIAPGVRLASTKMLDLAGEHGTVADWTTQAVSSPCNQPGNLNLCIDSAQVCTAVVQNHSHNKANTQGTNDGYYDPDAQQFDFSVRDADRQGLNRQLAITMSAGNYKQPVEDLNAAVIAPATAKNVITMGATESARVTIPARCQGTLGGENPLLRNSAGGYTVLAYVSRRGTNDGRLKPELLAPATLAAGPRSSSGSDSTYCMLAGDAAKADYPQYTGASGTSFAAPVAAGAVALLRYRYGNVSPAMYKAMLVAGARSIAGGLDRQTGQTLTGWPTVPQGFGLIRLDDLLAYAPARAMHDQGTILVQGSVYERQVTVSDPSKPVRIVVAWTDAPAAVGAQITLVNNLDLMAYWPDFSKLYGNYTDVDGWSKTPGGCGRPVCVSPADLRNNVEVLNINPTKFVDAANRTFTVRIIASPINGIGVPNQSGGANNQDFALFVLNGTLN